MSEIAAPLAIVCGPDSVDLYSSEAGRREATISFDVGQGTQDLGFRAEAPVLFDVAPAIPVTLSVASLCGQRPMVTSAAPRWRSRG